MFLTTAQSATQRVYKDEYPSASTLFCYYCQYFIGVTTNTTAQATYRLSVTQMADVGEEVPVITVGQSIAVTLPAVGAVAQRKFVLDNKESFSVSVTVSTG